MPLGDGFAEIPIDSTGDNDMANTGDISNDAMELVLTESVQSMDVLMQETLANGEGAASVIRYSGARKYNQEDPIEAAASEKILKPGQG